MSYSLEISVPFSFYNTTTYSTFIFSQIECDDGCDVPLWKRKRYLVFILTCFGFLNIAFMRNCFGVVILEMTAEKNIQLENGTWTLKREFEWDSKMQGYILSIFSYGFIITQFLGGLICAKFGGIRVLATGVGISSIIALSTPVVSQYGHEWVMVLRFLQGLAEVKS